MSETRKSDHIELAFNSQVQKRLESDLLYEPLLGSHIEHDHSLDIFGTQLKNPFWVSSMTGGTEKAKDINQRLAKACGKFGLGMGLGSCRPLLEGNDRLEDFAVKKYMGDFPLYANLGIAQIEELVESNKTHQISELVKKLEVDGLIIHVNPLQEALQLEGDRFKHPPIETIKRLLDSVQTNYIVKEVGQGMGPSSLKMLLDLPINGIELSAFGGTNFTYLEHSRHENEEGLDTMEPLLEYAHVGHTASEMIEWINSFVSMNINYKDKGLIISGGMKSVIKANSLKDNSKLNAIIGFASVYLRYALSGQEVLDEYISNQIKSLDLYKSFLKG